MLELEQTGNTTQYLSDKASSVDSLIEQLNKEGKASYIIEEVCMKSLIEDLKPSRYYYILHILEPEFVQQYNQFIESGLLLFEISNIIKYCNPVFDDLDFSEDNENNRFLSYAITGAIKEYLDHVTSEKSKGVRCWILLKLNTLFIHPFNMPLPGFLQTFIIRNDN